MSLTTDNAARLIEEGLDISELDATDRTTDNLIRLCHLILSRDRRPKILNAGEKTTDNLRLIHEALGGNVTFSGV